MKKLALLILLFSLNSSGTEVFVGNAHNQGVKSINGVKGAAVIVAGANITVTPAGQNITIAGSAAAGADTTLSNLTSPTSIPQDLIPSSNLSKNFGNSSTAWDRAWINNIKAPGAGTSAIEFSIRTLVNASGTNVFDWSGTDLSAITRKITNVVDPTSAQDAATKNYVDGKFLTGTSASLGGGALLAGACSSNATTVSGATTAMAVIVTPATYPGDGSYWLGYVSSADTVTTKVCVAVALTPTASTYNIRIVK